MRNRCLCLSMVLLGICLFLPQKSLAQSTIACNSDDERRHSCSANTRGGVQLVKQNSGSACTEGYSWGSDERGIWVDHGCRADFAVGGNRNYRDENRNEQNGGNRQSQTISCNSNDERRHSCLMDTQGGVRLVTQNSDSACTEGYSWGSDNQGIWVDHGCRADFSVGGNRSFQGEHRNDQNDGNRNVQDEIRNDQNGGNREYRDENRSDQNSGNREYRDENRNDQNGGNEESQTISCNSNDMRKHSCAVDTLGGGVRLLTQNSDAPCTKGYSWGTNRRGIWVDHGCRADFAVVAKYHQDSLR